MSSPMRAQPGGDAPREHVSPGGIRFQDGKTPFYIESACKRYRISKSYTGKACQLTAWRFMGGLTRWQALGYVRGFKAALELCDNGEKTYGRNRVEA